MPAKIPTTEPNWRMIAREQLKIMQRMNAALIQIAKPIEPPGSRVHSRERYWERAATERVSIASKAFRK